METCVFCRIIARTVPGFILDEDDDLVVFLSLENHPLVVPRKHVCDIFGLDDRTAALIMQKAVRIAKAVKAGTGCEGIYIGQSNGEAAGQDVFHFHLHVYPKWKGGKMVGTDDVARRRMAESVMKHLE